MIAWTAKKFGAYRLRLFELYAEGPSGSTKIGQCALGEARGRSSFVFLDRLQLLPEHASVWHAAMSRILEAAGAGRYTYGWALNLEAPREEELSEIVGVTITHVRPLTVQAVDFARWQDWNSYYRAVSENSRRNAKAARKNFKKLRVETRSGLKSALAVPAMMRLASSMSMRKGLDPKASGAALGYLATILSCPRYMTTSVAVGDGRELSCFYGAEFGPNTYYLEGASVVENGGGAWHLLLTMLERAYIRAPKGKFIMGYIDYATHLDERSAGLLRSRQSCRVSDYATSVVEFQFAPRPELLRQSY